MIFTIPITIIFFLISGLINLLPVSSGLPVAISQGFQYVFGFLYAFDFIMPVSSLILVLGLSLGFELAIQIWHGVHWILRKIPILHIK